MPDLYPVLLYRIFFRQLRSAVEWNPVYVDAPASQVTLTATCPGEIVSAAVEALNRPFDNDTDHPWGNVSPWYQTGDSCVKILKVIPKIGFVFLQVYV